MYTVRKIEKGGAMHKTSEGHEDRDTAIAIAVNLASQALKESRKKGVIHATLAYSGFIAFGAENTIERFATFAVAEKEDEE